MTAKVSDFKNSLYYRGYENDVPPQKSVLKRIALASLPFLSLHRALRMPLAVGMGSVRVWNSDGAFQMAGAAMSLAGTFFQFRAGQILTAIQDVALEARLLKNCGSREEAAKHLVKIVNHLVYLALISRGGLELSLLAFTMQAAVNLIQARDEFKGGRWIEGCANLLMAAVRLKQSHGQYQHLKRNWEIEAALKKVYVGKLGAKWRFPSDHLPVGVEVNGIRIMSWNVLNNAYMDWVTTKDSQGLNGSLISELDRPVGDSGLTMRDVMVADMVREMMARGDVVALQECGEPFLQALSEKLPSNWQMVRSFDGPAEDQDVILYDASRLTYLAERSETALDAYPSFVHRPIQTAVFSGGGEGLRVINGHIPGDPLKPGREEFARYVRAQHSEGDVTVALGDNNFEHDQMIEAYQRAGFSDFSLHSPWKTNIDPYTKESKGIDHLFVVGTEESRDLRPEDVLQNGNLAETIQLLNYTNS